MNALALSTEMNIVKASASSSLLLSARPFASTPSSLHVIKFVTRFKALITLSHSPNWCPVSTEHHLLTHCVTKWQSKQPVRFPPVLRRCPHAPHYQPLILFCFRLSPWLVDTHHKKSSTRNNLQCSQTSVKWLLVLLSPSSTTTTTPTTITTTTNQSTNQQNRPTDRPTDQPFNQSTNQPIYLSTNTELSPHEDPRDAEPDAAQWLPRQAIQSEAPRQPC